MSAFVGIFNELIGAVEMSKSGDGDVAVFALGIVRDGVITGEGPTTRGRIHFSRALDAQDAAWYARILTAMAVTDQHREPRRSRSTVRDQCSRHGAQ